MSFFSKALDDLQGLESDILGPDYPYYKYINSPSDMGMSADGDKIFQKYSRTFCLYKSTINWSRKGFCYRRTFR